MPFLQAIPVEQPQPQQNPRTKHYILPCLAAEQQRLQRAQTPQQ